MYHMFQGPIRSYTKIGSYQDTVTVDHEDQQRAPTKIVIAIILPILRTFDRPQYITFSKASLFSNTLSWKLNTSTPKFGGDLFVRGHANTRHPWEWIGSPSILSRWYDSMRPTFQVELSDPCPTHHHLSCWSHSRFFCCSPKSHQNTPRKPKKLDSYNIHTQKKSLCTCCNIRNFTI